MNILVLGAGGDIGQSIGKILKELPFIENVCGCDLNIHSASKFIYDQFYKSVPCSDASYLRFLEDKVKGLKIDLVLPVSEPELRFFAKNNLSDLGNCPLLLPNQAAMNMGFDKYNTIEFLKSNNFPYPKTFLFEEWHQHLDQITFPFILKARNSSGSKSVLVINDMEEVNFYSRKDSSFIIQERIPGRENEFTCGVFRSKEGEVRSIIINRTLTGGFTSYGVVENNLTISTFLNRLANAINLVGSINVQLKYVDNEPLVFEINPRFSSTVRFRDLMGFKDLKWALQNKIGIKIDQYSPVSSGTRFYKGYNEFIEKDDN